MSKLRKQAPKQAEEVTVEVATVEEVEVEGTVVVAVESTNTVSVIDNAVKNAEKVEVELETVASASTEPKVRINPKQDIRTFIGDQWYNLKAGKQVSVPRTVKEKLQKAGLLNPL